MQKWYDYLHYGFWLFLFGCVFGFFYESTLEFVKHQIWISRAGLLYGPFSQVYGIGVVVLTATLYKIKHPLKLFLVSIIVGGAAEYIMSLIQEYIFGTISWDYSSYFLNLNGRTSLFHAVCWGLLGFGFIKGILPYLISFIKKLRNFWGYVITICLVIFMTFNITISCLASIRQNERLRHIPASGIVDQFLDTHYPNERMDTTYNNKKYR